MISTAVLLTPEPNATFLHLHNPKPPTISKSRISAARNRPGAVAFYAVEPAQNLYEVLGIPSTGSSISDIKKAYKEMARKYHPDVSPPERVDENTRRFILVHEAYETLSNPQSRALYDGDLAGGPRRRSYETEEWKVRWERQLDELQRRSSGRGGQSSWAARMRAQNNSNQ